ncbi:hypothetical protein [Pseudodesulfovibrio pelocollis]|uniref:hypothetical protein n=1 Tax=Pseudodesulfovibrio pelocollis TaxID=3051432 RepID=UPI00255B153A|nr:hypothetical protein [Pseudodesulfovibrio sp. SB368]
MDLKSFTATAVAPVGAARAPMVGGSGAEYLGEELRNIGLKMAASRDEDDYHAAQLAFVRGLDGLDQEFEADEDIASLPARRAEKVKSLTESLYEGKSRRVQEKLKQSFEMASERDDIKWRNIVNKRDSANRVARYHEDTDVYLNHMIQAGDDDAYQKAAELWNGRLEAIRPHMSVTEFSRLRERHQDTVKYKRAWRSVSGDGEFDPTPFMDLGPDQVSQLEARHYAVAREKQRVIQERQVDRANALVPQIEDSLASAMTEGVPMDGTDGMLAELASLGERGAELAARYRERFSRSARVWNTLDAVKHSPFADRMQMMETLRPNPGSSDYRADMEMYQYAGQLVAQQAKAFQDDPAGYVREDAMRRARNAADPWVADEDLQPLVLRASMDLQTELGAAEPKVLGTNQAKEMKDSFERADGQGKADILNGLSTLGEYQRQGLAEMGLGYEHTFAAEAYMDDPFLGRRLLDVMSLKESDISVDPETATSIKKDVGAAYFSGPGEFFRQVYLLTGNAAHLKMNDQLHAMTAKVALAGGDANKAMDQLWNDRFDFVTDDDVLIYTPKDIDAEGVAGRLRAYRRDLPDDLAAFRDGVWKNSADGGGFVLVLPHGGTAMARDGEVVVVGYDELGVIGADTGVPMDGPMPF